MRSSIAPNTHASTAAMARNAFIGGPPRVWVVPDRAAYPFPWTLRNALTSPANGLTLDGLDRARSAADPLTPEVPHATGFLFPPPCSARHDVAPSLRDPGSE